MQLTRDPTLRTAYADSEWLRTQVENLARRSMMLAGPDHLADAFNSWFRRFEQELNRKTIQHITVMEVFGLTVEAGKKFAPLRHQDADGLTSWVQAGDLGQVADGLGMLLPPNLPRSDEQRDYERPDCVAVSRTRQAKTPATIDAPERNLSDDLFDFFRWAQLTTAERVTSGNVLFGEGSPFPSRDSHLIENKPPMGRVLGPRHSTLTPRLHRHIQQAQRTSPRLKEAFNSPRAIVYAFAKYERLCEERMFWHEQVVDVVSVLDSLFSAEREANTPVASRIAWLADVSESDSLRMLDRVRALYRVRNNVIHAGKVDDEQFRRALSSLEVDLHPGDPKRLALTHHWFRSAEPRLRELLRWSIETAIALAGADLLAWPDGQRLRDIDRDMLLGRSKREWRRALRGIAPPLRQG